MPPSLADRGERRDGTTYAVLPEESSSDFPEYWPELQIALEDASEPLTRARLRDRWAEGCPRPSIRTLWNWLNTACAENLVARSGTGRTNDPYRYWLPSKMSAWLADPLWCLIHGIPVAEVHAATPPSAADSVVVAAADPPPAEPAVLPAPDSAAPPAEARSDKADRPRAAGGRANCTRPRPLGTRIARLQAKPESSE